MENSLQSGQLNGNSSMLTTLNPTVLLRSVAVLHHLLPSWRNRGTDTYSKVRQSIKEEKQHFLTHLHHLEPHTADLSCSPSSGYTHVHLWNCNLKRNPTNKPHKNGCMLQKGSVADGRLAAPLAAVPWQWKFSAIRSSLASVGEQYLSLCCLHFTFSRASDKHGFPGSIPFLQWGKQAHRGEGFTSGHSDSVKHSSSSLPTPSTAQEGRILVAARVM